MQSTKLYIGIILGYGEAEVVSTGIDFDQVYKRTGEIWEEQFSKGLLSEENQDHVNTDFVVKEAPMPTLTPAKTPLPEWYTKVINTVSLNDIASHVVDRWPTSTLVDNAVLNLMQYYEDPDSLMEDLENGYIILDLEKDSNGEYDPEFLAEIAEDNDRDIQEYKDNDSLVILDALKTNF